MFDKILIANRGEIACRVIKTARRLGIRTVAVYAEADAASRHVDLADDAYPIGPSPARQSYLVIDKIIDAARKSGAQAIHPGYGFLSENAAFADACGAAGIVFIGPPPEAIRAMGSKSAAKALMEQSGVPLVPGYHGTDQDPAILAAAAGRIGYPVLIKASAGGGGKGMRIVEAPEGFAAGLASAQREAASSFGDDQMLVEKYLTRPRHIEIQIFADTQGNIVSLFERDCSIQRRHQKVVEEAPAPGLTLARRRSMGEAACAAARAIGYVGAGTVEFIAEGDSFYFMEMNTRLQVEHPVTEAITGQDLVEWQLRVAAGEPLPLGQDELVIRGHAIEVRVYAEDPARDFRPSTGRLLHLLAPEEGPHVRVDTGVRAGDAISVHYDPMIAKLIVWDSDRARAVQRLRRALAEYEIVGVSTNLAFLAAIAAHPAFGAGDLDTGFIGRHNAALFPPPHPAAAEVLAAAGLRVLLDRQAAVDAAAAASGDPWSPWNLAHSWRLNGDGYQDLLFRDGESMLSLRALPQPGGWFRLELAERSLALSGGTDSSGALRFTLDGVKHSARVLRHDNDLVILSDGVEHRLTLIDPLAAQHTEMTGAERLSAPMPGRIIQVLTSAGAEIRRGAALLVLEAMKMEHTITAPQDGTVESVRYAVGDLVEEGAELIVFAAPEER
jgi:3-methylcrotonyl-CoA carboxylase alpha subunit